MLSSLFKKNRRYLGLLISASILICFYDLVGRSLTLDEVSTIIFSRNIEFLKHALWFDEGNMWLYYIVMNLWLKLGDNEFALRSFSATAGVLSVLGFYFLAAEVAGKKTANIAAPLFMTNLYLVFYAQTARGYSISLLLNIFATYFFIKFVKNTSSNKSLFLFTISSILLLYSHLLSGLLIAINFVFIIFLAKPVPWKKILISAAAIFIGMLPLFISPAFHGHQLDWLQKPSLAMLPFGLLALSGDSIFFTVISSSIIVLYIFHNRLNKTTSWLIMSAFFPFVFAFFFSLLFKPVYEPESFNTSLPAFILLIAIGLKKLTESQRLIFNMTYSLLLFCSIFRLYSWYTEADYKSFVFQNKDPRDWRKAEKIVEDHKKPGDAIIFYSYYIRFPFSYYLNKSHETGLPIPHEIASNEYALGGGTLLPDPDYSILDTLHEEHERVWLVLSYDKFDWLKRKNQEAEVESQLKKRYELVEDNNLDQIEIKLYVRKYTDSGISAHPAALKTRTY